MFWSDSDDVEEAYNIFVEKHLKDVTKDSYKEIKEFVSDIDLLKKLCWKLYDNGYEVNVFPGNPYVFKIKLLDHNRLGINRLCELLDNANVPYEKLNHSDGKMVIIKNKKSNTNNKIIADCISNRFAYGHESGLLEICGGLTEEELKEDDVKGRLTPEEVAKRFIYCYRNKTDIYKEV